MRHFLILILSGVLLSSCGMTRRTSRVSEGASGSGRIPTAISTSSVSSSRSSVSVKLDQAYKKWKGVPYILGGSSYKGVDCSSFMQIVYKDYFDITLPRNTREQMKTGRAVKRRNISLGDMVFFKTGRNTFHVGVMINSEQFMHASTSSGVIISNIQNRYWADAYLTARRVL